MKLSKKDFKKVMNTKEMKKLTKVYTNSHLTYVLLDREDISIFLKRKDTTLYEIFNGEMKEYDMLSNQVEFYTNLVMTGRTDLTERTNLYIEHFLSWCESFSGVCESITKYLFSHGYVFKEKYLP